MGTGFCGTFVISWAQSEIDGHKAAPIDALNVGATWRWHGEAVRVDGPQGVLQLKLTDEANELRRRAARMVKRLVGDALERDAPKVETDEDETDAMDSSFVVTDGRQIYTVSLIDVAASARPLLMFLDEIPPRNQELWVVSHTIDALARQPKVSDGGMICFTPDTRITTPGGSIAVRDLRQGDVVQTKDNGPQKLRWVGSKHVTGARMFTMPQLKPVRINARALDGKVPDAELLVSPDHRILVRGRAAQDLFNTPEVLVTARDLVNGDTIRTDYSIREITYVHLLFDDHQVLWANGVESESYHPASADLAALSDHDRKRLLTECPYLEKDANAYGGFARRNLSKAEAAILQHAA